MPPTPRLRLHDLWNQGAYGHALRAGSHSEWHVGITVFRARDPVGTGPHLVPFMRHLRAPVPFSAQDIREL